MIQHGYLQDSIHMALVLIYNGFYRYILTQELITFPKEVLSQNKFHSDTIQNNLD